MSKTAKTCTKDSPAAPPKNKKRKDYQRPTLQTHEPLETVSGVYYYYYHDKYYYTYTA